MTTSSAIDRLRGTPPSPSAIDRLRRSPTVPVADEVATIDSSRSPLGWLALIVVLQAAWIAALASRGWFYTDDFQNMAQAVHRSLSVGYLAAPLNNHFAPGVRLAFWVMAHTSALEHWPTIVTRVLIQAVTTVALFRLLSSVATSRRLVLTVVAGYAFSPLLVPGTMWLTTAITLQIPQLAVILAFDAHVRHVRTGSRWWSVATGCSLLVAVAFWEKAGVAALCIVVLDLVWLRGNGWSAVRRSLRDWWGWLLSLAPLVGFAAYDVAAGHGKGAQSLPPHAAVHVVWLQWSHALWPAVIGAPWRWVAGVDVFQSAAAPRTVTVVLGQAAFVVLLAVSWRRNRWRGLAAWLLPAVAVVVGMLLVAAGRYAFFGASIALDFHYAMDLAVPTALAVVLALDRPRGSSTAIGGADGHGTPTPSTAPRHRRRWPVRSPLPGRLRGRLGPAVIVVAAAALLASTAVSAVSWIHRWHENPSRTYVHNLVSDVHELGPTATLYDTTVSLRVLPFIEGNRRVADLLAVAHVPVHVNNGPAPPQIVDDQGHVTPATYFVTSSTPGPTAGSQCSAMLHGATSMTLRFAQPPPPNFYFVRFEFVQPLTSHVTLTASSASGHAVADVGGSRLSLGGQLGAGVMSLDYGAPASVTFTSTDPTTNVCLSNVQLVLPVPAS